MYQASGKATATAIPVSADPDLCHLEAFSSVAADPQQADRYQHQEYGSNNYIWKDIERESWTSVRFERALEIISIYNII